MTEEEEIHSARQRHGQDGDRTNPLRAAHGCSSTEPPRSASIFLLLQLSLSPPCSGTARLSHPPSRSQPQPREARPSGHVNSANHGSGGAARSRQGAQARTTGPPSTAAGRLICLPLRRHRLLTTLPGFSRCHVACRSARLASPPRPGRACEELAASRIAYRAPRGQEPMTTTTARSKPVLPTDPGALRSSTRGTRAGPARGRGSHTTAPPCARACPQSGSRHHC